MKITYKYINNTNCQEIYKNDVRKQTNALNVYKTGSKTVRREKRIVSESVYLKIQTISEKKIKAYNKKITIQIFE